MPGLPARNGRSTPTTNTTQQKPSDEPYIQTAAKVLRVNSPVTITKAQRKIGKTCDLAFRLHGRVRCVARFLKPNQSQRRGSGSFKNSARRASEDPAIFGTRSIRPPCRSARSRRRSAACGPVTLNFSGAFLWIRLPSGRDIRLSVFRASLKTIAAHTACCLATMRRDSSRIRDGRGACGGVWTENIVSGLRAISWSRRCFVLRPPGTASCFHVHDELVCEVPIGFGSEEEFVELMTRKPAGPRGCRSRKNRVARTAVLQVGH